MTFMELSAWANVCKAISPRNCIDTDMELPFDAARFIENCFCGGFISAHLLLTEAGVNCGLLFFPGSARAVSGALLPITRSALRRRAAAVRVGAERCHFDRGNLLR